MHAESDDDGYHSSISYHTAAGSPSRAGGKSTAPAKGEDPFGVEKDKSGGLGKLSGMFSSSEPHLHVMLVHKEGTAPASSKPLSPAKAAAAATAASMASAAVAGGGGGASESHFDPSEVVKSGKSGGAGGGVGAVGLPPGDKLLGETFVNVVDLATARAKSLDEWFPLSEVRSSVGGTGTMHLSFG